MTDHIDDDDSDNDSDDSYSDSIANNENDSQENANEKPPLSASTKSSNRINDNNNWDVDSLLDKHMREIDDCDFGSLKCDALFVIWSARAASSSTGAASASEAASIAAAASEAAAAATDETPSGEQ